MKKYLLSFIGACCGCSVLMFLSAPYLIYSNSYDGEVISQSLTYWELSGILLAVCITGSVVSLLFIIKGVIEDKNYRNIIVPFAVLNGVSAIILWNNVSLDFEGENYTIGWGIVFVILLLLGSCALMVVDYILAMIKNKKTN